MQLCLPCRISSVDASIKLTNAVYITKYRLNPCVFAETTISISLIDTAILTVGFARATSEIRFTRIGLYSFLNAVFVHISMKCNAII